MKLTIELDREIDGRWIAEVAELNILLCEDRFPSRRMSFWPSSKTRRVFSPLQQAVGVSYCAMASRKLQ
jgi:hypothetical protein